ncbi:hypothetical protein [Bacillus sp. AG4(2022)]|uniref:hypothetical protein n=1 Tax=Bacillus sp. AG4(2022) TaxID=2962594 RepID=UPI002880F7A4|nr:hypothetical protein [Bacillus sp. AG4(2022)]MDT0159256.1 hypothetical protein [Bacillus sp. AG4(2022)]
MEDKIIDVRGRYEREISQIAHRLKDLEQGRVYGYNGNISRMDGALDQNIRKLRGEIADLLTKIEYGRKSDNEEIAESFNNFEL